MSQYSLTSDGSSGSLDSFLLAPIIKWLFILNWLYTANIPLVYRPSYLVLMSSLSLTTNTRMEMIRARRVSSVCQQPSIVCPGRPSEWRGRHLVRGRDDQDRRRRRRPSLIWPVSRYWDIVRTGLFPSLSLLPWGPLQEEIQSPSDQIMWLGNSSICSRLPTNNKTHVKPGSSHKRHC